MLGKVWESMLGCGRCDEVLGCGSVEGGVEKWVGGGVGK